MKKILNILVAFFAIGFFYFGYQLVKNLSSFNDLINLNGNDEILIEFRSLSIAVLLPIVFSVVLMIILIIKLFVKIKCDENVKLKEVISEKMNDISDESEDLKEKELFDLKKQLDSTKEFIKDYKSKNAEEIIKKTANIFNAAKGVIYEPNATFDQLNAVATFAHIFENDEDKISGISEGLIGQAIKNKKVLIIKNVPENYLNVMSGLGSSDPSSLLILPFYKENKIEFVLELALFKAVDENIKNGANYLFNFQSI